MMNFRRDERGNVAMMFALAMVPVCLLIGAALDYNRIIGFRDFLRLSGDAAALAIAGADTPDDGSKLLAAVKERVQEEYGNAADVTGVTGKWADSSTYAMKVSASLKTYLLPSAGALLPNFKRGALPVDVEIKVVRVPATYATEKPNLSLLDPEAGDYNRIYMYCYNPKRAGEADKGRRGTVAIADNGSPGLSYKDPMPTCGEGELVSYKLHNVRNMRGTPSKWDAKGQEVYDYWTDTTVDRGSKVMTHNLNGGRVDDSGKIISTVDVKTYPILETILCDALKDCKSVKDGGKIPNRATNRSPAVATTPCASGKYMYFGWEDRPGGDRDYDDIRLVISCPKEILVSDKQVHLSK